MDESLRTFLEHFAAEPLQTSFNDAQVYQLGVRLGRSNALSVLEHISGKGLLLELVLSNLHESTPLHTWIADAFPRDLESFRASFIASLMMRLSNFFLLNPDLPLPNNPGISTRLSQVDNLVSRGPYLLDMLNQLKGSFESSSVSKYDAKPKQKRSRKKSYSDEKLSTKPMPPIDPTLLLDFGQHTPECLEACNSAIAAILAALKTCLEFYLQLLSHEPMAMAIENQLKVQLSTNNASNDDAYYEPEINAKQLTDSHPVIQPFKFARHFSNVEGFGDWRILISTKADADLRDASRKNKTMFRIFVKKIKELSNGHFSPDNHKRLTGPKNEVPVYEAKMTGDTRLVYQIDCLSDYGTESSETQAIRIFGIYTHAQMDDRLWHSVGSQLARRGREYRKRCIYRQHAHGTKGDIYVPATFPHPPEPDVASQALPDLPPDNLEQIHSLLILEKYLDFSQELLQSILAGLDVSFPFQISAQEKEIVEHPHSCYVLGRSGTGKTTTMLFKMLWVEKAYECNKDDMPKPRQVFVTKSRMLAQKVEESFTKMLASLRIEAKPLQELQKLFKQQKVVDRNTEEPGLVDEDDEVHWRSDLPNRFSELQDHHFPLFLTFDRLCNMIEGDFATDPQSSISARGDTTSPITFETFQYQYWPHFSQSLTKGLDPSLVYSEIIGIIRGSEDTLTSQDTYLARSTYEALSERSYSTFASQRSVIYSIFEAYQLQKRQRLECDIADRTHALLRAITTKGIKGKKFDQLYVDEAQDNLLIDALVLRSLSRNPNGLFWAGDTAQTISVGSAFRFDDLKAFLYRIERQRLRKVGLLQTGVKPPKDFQLVTNYRSHGGIVNCAHSVIDLITKFWPYSIDKLQPEKGIVDGLKPLFLVGWDDDNVRYEQFLFGSNGSHIEFGAQQCILVRDEAARSKLEAQVGKIGLIMTLYESKGLEFNDVLLFNFFEDSVCDVSQWRVILNQILNKPISQSKDGMNAIIPLAPRFDPIRHAPICFELKLLYVALTRARKNLWIADRSTKGEPMRLYWSSRTQVQTCSPGDQVPQLAVASSEEEWAFMGQELFRRKRYLQAKYCYERANQLWGALVSDAYMLREEARKILVASNSQTMLIKRQESFVLAANAFIKCSQDSPKNRLVYLVRAAECYEQGGDDLHAARAYLDAESFNNAAKLFRKLGRFDDAVTVIKANSKQMDSNVVESIKDVARLYYFREEQLGKARNLFVTDDEELEYLEDLDLDVARADVLVSLGRYREAAQLHVSEGRTIFAIPLFLKDKGDQESSRQAGRALLQELWREISFGRIDTPANSTNRTDLLHWLEDIRIEDQDPISGKELSMFKALMLRKTSLDMVQLAEDLFALGDTPAALLCLDQHFSCFPDPKGLATIELIKILTQFLFYIRCLQDMALRANMYDNDAIEKLFGCHFSTGDTITIPQNTFLHDFLMPSSHLSKQISSESSTLSVSRPELNRIMFHALRRRLRDCISIQFDACKRSVQSSSCLNFAVAGFCNRISCPNEHVSINAVTPHWYTTKVRLNLLQIAIHQVLYSLGNFEGSWLQKRLLLDRFYESVSPSFHALGTLNRLETSSIPEWSRGLHVVRCWTQELAESLDLRGNNPYILTNLIRGAKLGYWLDEQHASVYWQRSLYRKQLGAAFIRPTGASIAFDLILSTECRDPRSLCAGILGTCHIVNNRLPINVGTLCETIESICGSIITSARLQSGHGPHGLTLPLSWAFRCLFNPALAHMRLNDTLNARLVDVVAELLEIICTGDGADFLLFDNGNLSSISSANIRGVFILRLVRAICILGYNLLAVGLRANILKAVSSLRKVDKRLPVLYRQFVECRHWDHLVKTLRGSVTGGLPDGLMQLHDLRQAPPRGWNLHGVTPLEYKNEDDLYSQLSGQNCTQSTPTVVMPDDVEGVSFQTPNDEASIASMPIQPIPETADDNAYINPDAHSTDLDTVTPEPSIIDAETAIFQEDNDVELLRLDASHEVTVSEEEVTAATLLQRRYRQAAMQRTGKEVKGLAAIRQRLFKQCLKRASNMDRGQSSSYRCLFLGPLPHFLLCLEVIASAIAAQKTNAKQRFRSGKVHHQELDMVSLQLTRLQHTYKALLRLRDALDPTSKMHESYDCAELRRWVKDGHQQLQNLPIAFPQEIGTDLALAIKGIVTKAKPRKQEEAEPKPSLVLDNDIDIYF